MWIETRFFLDKPHQPNIVLHASAGPTTPLDVKRNVGRLYHHDVNLSSSTESPHSLRVYYYEFSSWRGRASDLYKFTRVGALVANYSNQNFSRLVAISQRNDGNLAVENVSEGPLLSIFSQPTTRKRSIFLP